MRIKHNIKISKKYNFPEICITKAQILNKVEIFKLCHHHIFIYFYLRTYIIRNVIILYNKYNDVHIYYFQFIFLSPQRFQYKRKRYKKSVY